MGCKVINQIIIFTTTFSTNMNLIKLFFIVTSLSFFGVANAQNVKPKFKKLIFIGYYANTMSEHGPHIIDYTIQFNENDSVHYTANNFGRNNVYGMSDTTYTIPDTLMKELNKIFNGKKALRSHMITDKLPNGDTTYAGHIYFITYTSGQNTSDSFIAVQPFLDKELSGLVDKITSIQRARAIIRRKIYKDSSLEARILDYQKTCKYIPHVPPPTVKSLTVASPSGN
jgi:hypothetical protein